MQNYFPATYQQYYPQQNYSLNYPSQQASSPHGGIIWVDGVSSAKAYPVANGTSILLMDSNENTFYIKSADQSGMPSIRVFDYSERIITTNAQPQAAQVSEQPIESAEIDLSAYVTKEELKKVASDIEKKLEALSPTKTSSRKAG